MLAIYGHFRFRILNANYTKNKHTRRQLMELTSTKTATNNTAVVGIYGPPGSGKTACLATALNLGNMIYCLTPGEGDASRVLSDYNIPMVKLETYGDLMALYAALIGDPNYRGDDTDAPIAKPYRGDKAISGYNPEDVKKLIEQFKKVDIKTIAFDAGAGIQQLFSQQSIEFWGKDLGMGRYGDIANLTKSTLLKFSTIPGIKMVVWITLDQQITDERDGQIRTYREMAFEGKKSREIVPPACNFVLPVFTGEELGLDPEKREWEWKHNGGTETRNRFFLLSPARGFWAKARNPLSLKVPEMCRADLSALYKKFYETPIPKKTETKTKETK
jgi:hypothetical protein